MVYAPAELMALLANHVERTAVQRGDWLLTNAGQPLNRTPRGTSGGRSARPPGSGYTLRDLRHLYASGLIAPGCDVVTVQRSLGHSSATITLAVYSHLWPTAEDRTRAAAGDLMAAALGASADSLRTGRR